MFYECGFSGSGPNLLIFVLDKQRKIIIDVIRAEAT